MKKDRRTDESIGVLCFENVHMPTWGGGRCKKEFVQKDARARMLPQLGRLPMPMPAAAGGLGARAGKLRHRQRFVRDGDGPIT